MVAKVKINYLCVFFFLSLSDHFPDLQELNASFAEVWEFVDITLAPVSPFTYNMIKTQWRNKHFDSIVTYVAESAVTATPAAIRSFTRTLPEVWKEVAEPLASKALVIRTGEIKFKLN